MILELEIRTIYYG